MNLSDALAEALKCQQTGQLSQAEKLCRQLLAADSMQPDAWHILGIVMGQMGRKELAVQYLKETLRLKPDLAEGYINLGNALREAGRLPEAETAYKKCLELRPDLAEAHYNLGNCRRDLGKAADAVESFQAAAKVRPNYVKALNNLGNTLLDLGRAAEAAQAFQKAVELNPKYVAGLCNLGITMRRLGKPAEAVTYLHRALAIDPKSGPCLNNLGAALNELGRTGEATAVFNTLGQINPEYPKQHQPAHQQEPKATILPLGVVARVSVYEDSPTGAEARELISKLTRAERPLGLLPLPSVEKASLSNEHRSLFTSLEATPPNQSWLTVTQWSSAVGSPDPLASYNVLWIPSTVEIPSELPGVAQKYDGIWVASHSQADLVRRSGGAPEKVSTVAGASKEPSVETQSQHPEQLIQAIERRFQTPPPLPADPNRIRVVIEGEFFAGNSFSNINEVLARKFAADPTIDLSLKRLHRVNTKDEWLPGSRELLPYLNRPLAGPPDITLFHSWPPNLKRPEHGKSVHVQWWEWGYLPTSWLEPFQRDIDEVWAISRHVQNAFPRSGIPAEKVQLINWGIDPAVFNPDVPPRNIPTDKSFRFVFVGGTIQRKGYDRLLQAYLAEFKPQDDVCLVVKDIGALTFYRGASYRDQTLAAQKDPRLPTIIWYEGEWTPGQLASLYTACHCMVAPYRAEGFGMPIIEALACGVAPIVPSGGPTDDFVNPQSGYLLPSKFVPSKQSPFPTCGPPTEIDVSINDLRAAMRQAYEQRDRTREMGRIGSTRIRSEFTWDHTARQMINRFHSLSECDAAKGVSKPTSLSTAHYFGSNKQNSPQTTNGRHSPSSPGIACHFRSPLTDPSGYANDGRFLLKALSLLNRPLSAEEIRWSNEHVALPESELSLINRLKKSSSSAPRISITNAIPHFCRPDTNGVYKVLRTTWETNRIPDGWINILKQHDELWVYSEHNRRAFHRGGFPFERIHLVPSGVDVVTFTPHGPKLNLSKELGREFIFLSVFDWQMRKGWDALLRSYCQEYSANDDVVLLLQISRSHGHSMDAVRCQADHVLREIGQSLTDRSDIVIWDKPLNSEQMAALYRGASAFVLPSRGEGWGRPYLEALACGIPTIGTNGSGQEDFLSESNSFVVSTKEVEVSPEAAKEIPIFAGQTWCEPDQEALRHALRQVREDSSAAKEKARRGLENVRARYTLPAVAALLEKRLAEIESEVLAKKTSLVQSACCTDPSATTARPEAVGVQNNLIGDLSRKASQGASLKAALGSHVFAVVARTQNGLFAVDPEDCEVGGQLRTRGTYGSDELERLRPHITPNSKVLVVGAHVGALAIPISKTCKKVVAIEANPATFRLLTINIALNAAVNCHAINVAASNKQEEIGFLLSRANSGGSKRVPLIKSPLYYYDNPETITVAAASLDEFLDEKYFDVVVMDIEGSEYFALGGMQKILSSCRLLVVEFLPHHLKNVSGVSVDQFLSMIGPHFSRMTVPSRRCSMKAQDFRPFLSAMYDHDQCDYGLMFEKG